MEPRKTEWHLDQKTILALIFALLCNTGGYVWWAAKLDSTVNNHERRIKETESGVALLQHDNATVRESLARIQETQKYQTDMLKEVREDVKKGISP